MQITYLSEQINCIDTQKLSLRKFQLFSVFLVLSILFTITIYIRSAEILIKIKNKYGNC